MALDALSDADKASNKAVLEKTREFFVDAFRGEVGAKLASNIANGVQLQHIKEYMDSIEAIPAPLLHNPPLHHPHHPGQTDWARKRSWTPL
jgi:hypothetical protein